MNIKKISEKEKIKETILVLKEEFKYLFEKVDLDDYCKKLSEKAYVIVAKEQDDIIGFLAIYINDNANYVAYITLIGVSKKFQMRGYGSKLLNYANDLAKKNGMKYIRLEVDNRNEKAERFYKKNGFILESFSENNSSFLIKMIDY